MKIALASALLATAASASVIQHRDGLNEAGLALDLAAIEQIVKRASPQAPNGYTPARVNCPSTRPSLRDAHTLSPEETAWLEKRRNATIDPMREWLTRMNITGFDANTYLDGAASNASILPNIGIAVSGGG
ncbi:Lysophospholipase 3, partial [Coniosporium uncinatum]